MNIQRKSCYTRKKEKTLQFIYSTCTPIYIKRKLPPTMPVRKKEEEEEILFSFLIQDFCAIHPQVMYISTCKRKLEEREREREKQKNTK